MSGNQPSVQHSLTGSQTLFPPPFPEIESGEPRGSMGEPMTACKGLCATSHGEKRAKKSLETRGELS